MKCSGLFHSGFLSAALCLATFSGAESAENGPGKNPERLCEKHLPTSEDEWSPSRALELSRCVAEHPTPNNGWHQLQKALAPHESGFLQILKTSRLTGKTKGALQLAALAEKAFPESPLIRQELSEVYLSAAEPLPAAKSFLRWVQLEPERHSSIGYQLRRLIGAAQTEWSPEDFLDTLILEYPGHDSTSYQVLESLGWHYGHYPGAMACVLGQLGLRKKIPWEWIAQKSHQFAASGLYEYATAVLNALPWRDREDIFSEAAKAYLSYQRALENWDAMVRLYREHPRWELYDPKAQEDILQAIVKSSAPDSLLKDLRRKAVNRIQSLLEKKSPREKTEWVVLLAQARIKEGRFQEARKLLQREKENPKRRQGTGPLFYWSAVAALLQKQYSTADSLLVLAGAYQEHSHTMRALEMRQWLLLDSAAQTLDRFVQGLPESPLDLPEKLHQLKQVPPSSPLWIHAAFESARLWQKAGVPDSALAFYQRILAQNPPTWAYAKASAQSNFLKEAQQSKQESLAVYGEILVKYQQGIIAEFSRERINILKRR